MALHARFRRLVEAGLADNPAAADSALDAMAARAADDDWPREAAALVQVP